MKPKDMWESYCKSHNVSDEVYEAWAFGGDPDKLAELVVQGIKTATSSLYILYEIEQEALPEEGGYSVILDSCENAKCIIQTTKVYRIPFHNVSEVHAYREGEGDRSLAYWRESHRDFFADSLREAGLSFNETMDVVCEEFEVVYVQ